MTTTTLSNGSTLTNGTILSGNTDIILDNQSVYLAGTLNDAGTLSLASVGDATALIIDSATVNLTGGGVIMLSDSPANQIYSAGASTATLINNDTIEGAGNIGINSTNNPLFLTNASKGVIDATGVNALIIQPGFPTVTNAGLMEATGAGGLVITNNTTINQTGGTLLASGTGHDVYLQGGADIIGGVLRGTGGGLIAVNGQATLDGSGVITIAAATTVQVHDNQALSLLGNIDNLGTISLASVGDFTQLIIASTAVTLNGGGVLQFSDTSANRIYGGGGGDATLINFNNTIQGSGDLGINSNNNPLALINDAAGVIDATGTASALVIQSGGPVVINNGLMEATGAAGLEIYNTVVDQTGGGKLLASGAGDNVYLQGGAEILGGSLRGTLGGSFAVASGGATLGGPSTVSAITIAAATTVTIDDNQALTLFGTVDNLGTIAIGSGGNYTDLIINGPSVVLTGGGVLAMDNFGVNRIYGANSTFNTLINLNNTIEGAGQIGINSGNNPLALTNDSVINANQGNALVIQSGGPAVINNKLIEATGAGGLVIYSTQINNASGTLAAAGGNVLLESGADIVGGTLASSAGGVIADVTGATLDGSGVITMAAGSTVQVNDNQSLYLLGTIVDNGTLSLASGGNFTQVIVASPTVVLSGSGVLSMSDTSVNRIYGGNTTDTTLINKITIEGAGQIGANSGNNPLAVTNDGVIDATGVNVLYIQPGGPPLINAGLIEATNTGGVVITNGATIEQTGGTILASGTGNNIYLESGADVVGGLLLGTGGGSFVATGGSDTLDGSTGALTIGVSTVLQLADNQNLYLLGNFDNLGTIFLNSVGDTTNLILASPTVSLTGGGTLLMSDNGANRIYSAGAADETLINVNNTIKGAGQIGANSGANPLALTNQAAGVIDASSVAALVIQTGGPALINAGLIEATNTGGLLITNNTTIQQTGGTILASGSGHNVYLASGADISGGLLLGTGGGSFNVTSGSTLDGSTSVLTIGTLTTLVENDNQQLTLLGTINNLGTIAINSGGDITDVLLANGTVSLTGGGVLMLSNTTANRIYNGTLVNVNNTIEGAGQIGAGSSVPLALFNGGVIDANQSNPLYINSGGPVVTNSGVLEATAGGTLIINNTSVTDTTTGTIAAYDASVVSFQSNGVLVNEIAGTLTGGSYDAFAVTSSASLELTGSGPLTVDAANIVLSGTTGSEISFYNTVSGTYTAIETSLTAVSAGGTLQLDAGRDYVTSNALTINANGHLDLATGTLASAGLVNAGTIFGNGKIALGLTNTGKIEAAGGKLTVTGSIGGTGSIVIDRGASFELGTSTSEAVVFAAGPATLILDQPAAYTGALTSLTAGDSIDLVNTLVSSATITGGKLVASLTSGGTLSFNETAAQTQTRLVTASDGHGGTDITLFQEAVAGTISPTPVNFGQQHAGASLSETYTIANTAPVSPYSENLNASMGAASGSVTDSGSFTGLRPGATNSSALHATLASSAAGVVSGTATVNLYTTGSGVAGDGSGTLSIGSQTVSETATIFNYATASTAAPVNFGQHHVGDTLSQFIVLGNTAAPGAFSENLDASFSGTSTNVTGTGSVSELSAGGTSSTGLSLGLNSGTAGVQSGSATLGLKSDGAGIDTLGTTALPSETIAASGTLFNFATASTVAPVNFGIVHVGQSASQTVLLGNNAAPGAFSENLNGSFSGTSTGFTATGSVSELAAGSASSALSLQLNTSKAGVFSGTSTLGLVSDGSGIDTLGTTTLGSELVGLTGTVNNFATLGVSLISGPGKLTVNGASTLTLNLGTVALGAADPTESLGILNTAKGPADLLNGNLSISGGSSSFIDNSAPSFSGIGAGSESTGHTISLKTGSAGTFSETITVHSSGTNASGYSGALATETFIVVGTVTSGALAVAADTAAIAPAGHAMNFLAPSTPAAAAQAGPLTGAAAWGHIPALQTGVAGGLASPNLALGATEQAPLTIASAGFVSQYLASDASRSTPTFVHSVTTPHWLG